MSRGMAFERSRKSSCKKMDAHASHVRRIEHCDNKVISFSFEFVLIRVREAVPRERKIHKVLKEHKQGKLKSGSGKKVKSRKQAVAIALSEARRSGATIPKKKPS